MSGKKYDFNLDDKDLALAGMALIGIVYTVGAFLINTDPADVLFVIIAAMGSLAVGRRKE